MVCTNVDGKKKKSEKQAKKKQKNRVGGKVILEDGIGV
jgi:hypothetical protein